MWRIDIGSSVSPENESGNTRGFAGVDAGREAPVFFLGFATVGSPDALSKMAPRSLILGEERIPVSTMTCALAGDDPSAAARSMIRSNMMFDILPPKFMRPERMMWSLSRNRK